MNFQDIFANLCVVDSDKYFLCDLGVMRELASLIEHVDLTIASRFAVCCAPISLEPFLSSMFVQVRWFTIKCIREMFSSKCFVVCESHCQ